MKLSSEDKMLSSREDGEAMRKKVLHELETQPVCELDFCDIDVVTPSFADELFAKLVCEIGITSFKQKVKITNANSEIRSSILFAINNRVVLENRRT